MRGVRDTDLDGRRGNNLPTSNRRTVTSPLALPGSLNSETFVPPESPGHTSTPLNQRAPTSTITRPPSDNGTVRHPPTPPFQACCTRTHTGSSGTESENWVPPADSQPSADLPRVFERFYRFDESMEATELQTIFRALVWIVISR